jgi:uncharacterized caspase-like protein
VLRLLCLWFLLGCSTAAAAENKVALVSGNAAYGGTNELRNPVNDARAMANALQALSFDVIERENAGQREMNRAIAQFGMKLRGMSWLCFTSRVTGCK